jgi:hypothetical protein
VLTNGHLHVLALHLLPYRVLDIDALMLSPGLERMPPWQKLPLLL